MKMFGMYQECFTCSLLKNLLAVSFRKVVFIHSSVPNI